MLDRWRFEIKLQVCAFCGSEGEAAQLQRVPVHRLLGATTVCVECRQLMAQGPLRGPNAPRGIEEALNPTRYDPGPEVQALVDRLCHEAGLNGRSVPSAPELAAAVNAASILSPTGGEWSGANLFQFLRKRKYDRNVPWALGIHERATGKSAPPTPFGEAPPAELIELPAEELSAEEPPAEDDPSAEGDPYSEDLEPDSALVRGAESGSPTTSPVATAAPTVTVPHLKVRPRVATNGDSGRLPEI